MTPRISPLTQAFLSAAWVDELNPAILRECWLHEDMHIVPRQPTNEIRARITHCLDQVAM